MSGTVSTRWYFPDWQSGADVHGSSLAARGLWMEMLCIAAGNKGRDYGFVLVGGRKPTEEQVAKLAGCSVEEVLSLTSELEANRVFNRDRRGVIYCRRMVRAEKNRGNGRHGGNPNIMKMNEKQKPLQPSIPGPEPEPTLFPSGKRDRPRKTNTTLSPDWQPTVADLDYAAEHGFDRARALQLAGAFADYHHAKGDRMARWDAAWRTWVRNEVKFAARAQRPGRGGGMARVALNLMRQNQNRGGA